ncbi:15-hydroxyprostaglandin dehydrogenase [NAD(+)]-like [Helicoverpa armigera]|uniref:15-hydroxyprostaglandin dehydrogenase [NAD(+)]-like n=1 Tax=Helicoverpa armigera TaxID=29058 RepID=UPI0030831340
MQWDPKDKTFLITGGASGLGAEYAQAFLEHGAKKVAILDIAVEVGKATAERLNKSHPDKAVFISCDVSKEEDIADAFAAALAQLKQIDVIINNAGIMVDAPNMWRTACDVNWQGLISFTLKGIKHMRKDEGGAGGTIINISSVAAISKNPALPIYFGSKMAVLHFGQCIAMGSFFDDTGVRVLTMCPGATDTPLLHNLEQRAYDPKLGKGLADIFELEETICQKTQSAVTAVLHMYKVGAPATTWLTMDDKPARDITATIDSAFDSFEKALFN